jgi:hypothetical protein
MTKKRSRLKKYSNRRRTKHTHMGAKRKYTKRKYTKRKYTKRKYTKRKNIKYRKTNRKQMKGGVNINECCGSNRRAVLEQIPNGGGVHETGGQMNRQCFWISIRDWFRRARNEEQGVIELRRVAAKNGTKINDTNSDIIFDLDVNTGERMHHQAVVNVATHYGIVIRIFYKDPKTGGLDFGENWAQRGVIHYGSDNLLANADNTIIIVTGPRGGHFELVTKYIDPDYGPLYDIDDPDVYRRSLQRIQQMQDAIVDATDLGLAQGISASLQGAGEGGGGGGGGAAADNDTALQQGIAASLQGAGAGGGAAARRRGTPEEHARKVRVQAVLVKLKADITNDREAEDCGACLMDFTDDIDKALTDYENSDIYCLKCNHLFHKECLYHWIDNKLDAASCPICRGPIDKYIMDKGMDKVTWSEDNEKDLQDKIGASAAAAAAGIVASEMYADIAALEKRKAAAAAMLEKREAAAATAAMTPAEELDTLTKEMQAVGMSNAVATDTALQALHGANGDFDLARRNLGLAG